MGEVSAISWTDATFNPWMGCQRVSPACEHCYAETLVTSRMRLAVWGPPSTTGRQRTSASNWALPRRWDRAAAKAGTRTRVFCASLADVFEDHPAVAPWRAELFAMIEQTLHLDWMLLTKRPQNIRAMVPEHWLVAPRRNVWFGTTVEDQRRAEERVPELLATPAAVRFLSCEPLLGPVTLGNTLGTWRCTGCGAALARFDAAWRWAGDHWQHRCPDDHPQAGHHRAARTPGGIDWVIAGGESGADARPMHPDWARGLRDECAMAGVPFHFKQWGEWRDRRPGDRDDQPRIRLTDRGENGQTHASSNDVWMQRVGKGVAGHLLDGRAWQEFPEPRRG